MPRGFKKDGTKLGFKKNNKDAVGHVSKGRPRGAKDKLTADFLHALAVSFQRRGLAAIERVISSNPSAYLYLIAQLIPKESKATIDLNVNSEPISELNRWIEGVARTTRAITIENTVEDRPLLSSEVRIEPPGCTTPLDTQTVPDGASEPEWLSGLMGERTLQE